MYNIIIIILHVICQYGRQNYSCDTCDIPILPPPTNQISFSVPSEMFTYSNCHCLNHQSVSSCTQREVNIIILWWMVACTFCQVLCGGGSIAKKSSMVKIMYIAYHRKAMCGWREGPGDEARSGDETILPCTQVSARRVNRAIGFTWLCCWHNDCTCKKKSAFCHSFFFITRANSRLSGSLTLVLI